MRYIYLGMWLYTCIIFELNSDILCVNVVIYYTYLVSSVSIYIYQRITFINRLVPYKRLRTFEITTLYDIFYYKYTSFLYIFRCTKYLSIYIRLMIIVLKILNFEFSSLYFFYFHRTQSSMYYTYKRPRVKT